VRRTSHTLTIRPTNAFPADCPPVAYPVGFRPRLQWRAREGFTPSSRTLHLYSHPR
jgi:hypothetical protein